MEQSAKEWTVEEVIEYRKTHPPVKHVYGKYGTLAKKYLEEHNPAKYWALEDVPKYLHGVDKAAGETWDVMYEKLSRDPRYKRTGNFIEDVRRENEKKRLIEEEILNEIVYVD